MAEMRRRLFQGRSFISFLLTLAFLWMTVAGVVLYLGPPGGVARRTGWAFWGMGRDEWMAQHIACCGVFVVASLVHIWLNYRALWAYMHSQARRGLNRRWEMLAATALTAFLIAGTIWNLPPWNWVLSGSRHLTSYRGEARHIEQGGQGKGSGDGTGHGYHGGRAAGKGDGKGATGTGGE